MKNIKKLQLIGFIGGMYYYTPIFTLFLLQRSIDVAVIVTAQTMFSVAMMVSVIPTGVLADKFGQKITIQIGLLLDALGMMGLLFVQGPLGLIIFFASRGISVGFRHGSDEALLYDSYVDEFKSADGYSKAYGKLMSNDVLGFVIATALAGIAVQFFGQASYVPLIVVTSLSTLVAFGIASSLDMKNRRMRQGPPLRVFAHVRQGVKAVRRNRPIFALTLAGLLTLNGEYFLRQTYQISFQSMAVPALFLGMALSAGKLLNFITIRNAHRLEKFLTVDQILLFLNVALGASFLFFATAKSPFILVVVFVAIQALLNVQQPIVSDYVNQEIPSQERSTTLSALSFTQNIGEIIARLILGVVIGLVGLNSAFVAQGAYLIIGTLIGVWYLRRCGCVHKIKDPQTIGGNTPVAQ